MFECDFKKPMQKTEICIGFFVETAEFLQKPCNSHQYDV